MTDTKRTIYLQTINGNEVEMIEIPPGSHDGALIASEFQPIVQRAYELGRSHQQEEIERRMQDALHSVKPR